MTTRCSHLVEIREVVQSAKGCRGLPQDRQRLGPFAPVPRLADTLAVATIAESARHRAFPCDGPSDDAVPRTR